MKNISIVLVTLSLMLMISACANVGHKDKERLSQTNRTFAKGADISWITQIENMKKYHFINDEGKEMDGFQLLKDCGMNMVRLRVWKNPSPDRMDSLIWCDTQDLIVKALRAKQLGMDIMIDFHYSNWWADPGQQHVPREWKDCDINALCDSVANHTKEVLTAVENAGITPKWIQIGNETPTGFMKPLGDAVDNPENFARLFRTGYNAAKEIFPDAICMVHIDNGFDLKRTTFILDILEANDVKYDMLGWSLYPMMNWLDNQASIDLDWTVKTKKCLSLSDTIYQRYGKEAMIVEVGGPAENPKECKELIEYILSNVPEHLRGLIWWEPITVPEYKYSMGAMKQLNDSTFTPNEGLKGFSINN